MPEFVPDLAALRRGGKRALAKALAQVETSLDAQQTVDLLDEALASPVGFCLGLTGPPGVGKSTLIDALVRAWRSQGRTVGVIAVDPSSRRSGGALLGDRTRLTTDPEDQGVFVRSMAARDQLGGLAHLTFPAMVLMRAIYDLVIVETVGVGQSETEIAEIADLTAFCAQPGSGDALQFMKAGIMEIPDLVIVTKADMGQAARRTASDLRGALSLTANGRDQIEVLSCSATTGEGIDGVIDSLVNHHVKLLPLSAELCLAQANRWTGRQILSEFGSHGLQLVHRHLVDNPVDRPFSCNLRQRMRLSAALCEAFR